MEHPSLYPLPPITTDHFPLHLPSQGSPGMVLPSPSITSDIWTLLLPQYN